MEYVDCAIDELCISEGGSSRGRKGMRVQEKEFKSKNLQAERKRRQKLSDRLLALRALVPIITNMNKATIIEDAITFIKQLQKNVEELSDQLLEMEASSEEGAKQRSDGAKQMNEKMDAAEEMKRCGIEEDVTVTRIDGSKFWLKIVTQKKRCSFTKLIEAMSYLGFEFTDTSVTTSKGAILISACVEGIHGETLAVTQTRELLLEIIRDI